MPRTTTSDVWIVADALIGRFGTEAASRAWHELQRQRADDFLHVIEPPFGAPRAEGFGSDLIRHALAYRARRNGRPAQA